MARETCPNCRAVYDVVMRKARVIIADHFNCVVCGEQLKSCKSSDYPEFHFVKRGQDPANGA